MIILALFYSFLCARSLHAVFLKLFYLFFARTLDACVVYDVGVRASVFFFFNFSICLCLLLLFSSLILYVYSPFDCDSSFSIRFWCAMCVCVLSLRRTVRHTEAHSTRALYLPLYRTRSLTHLFVIMLLSF